MSLQNAAHVYHGKVVGAGGDVQPIFEKDIVTRKLNLTPDLELSNISSTETVYLFANENVAYISDISEAVNNGVTYKVQDGLIYLNGTASSLFYIPVDLLIPTNWAGSAIIGTIEVVSGTISGANIKLRTQGTYMSSGTEKQLSLMQDVYGSLQMISVTSTSPDIQVQSGAVCTNLVLRPYFALRNKANEDISITPRPTAKRTVASGTIEGETGTLMTINGADFTAHVKSRNPLSVLFGKRLALCGDSIAYGHSGDSFGYTIAENENMAFDKFAWGTARLSSTSPVISIAQQVANMTKPYDYIIVEGGINDALNSVTLGTLTSDFDSELDVSTAIGATEQICKTLVSNYPNAKKLFVLCHKCTNANCVPYSVQETFFAGIITALEKWNIPYIDIRKFPLCAYTVAIGQAYFGSDFGSGGSLHPNNAGYALGYVDQITNALKTDLSDQNGPDPSGKADKVSNATNGNFAGLDSNGNLTDSGKKASDFVLTSAIGTAAAKDVPTSGNASASQVVMGNDTRLSDSRTPTSHDQAASTITAGTFAGRVQANATAAATLGNGQVRDIFAGTSDATPGTTALTTGSIYIVYEA